MLSDAVAPHLHITHDYYRSDRSSFGSKQVAPLSYRARYLLAQMGEPHVVALLKKFARPGQCSPSEDETRKMEILVESYRQAQDQELQSWVVAARGRCWPALRPL